MMLEIERQAAAARLRSAIAAPALQALILSRRHAINWHSLMLYRSIWGDLLDLRAISNVGERLRTSMIIGTTYQDDRLYFHILHRMRVAYSGGALVSERSSVDDLAYNLCREALTDHPVMR